MSNIDVLRRPVETAQYLSIKYTERLAAAEIDLSVGSVGDAYDNALAECVIHSGACAAHCGPTAATVPSICSKPR